MNIFVYEEQYRDHFWWEDLLLPTLMSCGIEVKSLEIQSDILGLLDSWTTRGSHQVFILVLYGDSNRQEFFELARRIRQLDPLSQIIVVADTLFYMEDVLKTQVGVLDYILKDLQPCLFRQRLASLLMQVHSNFILDTPKEQIIIQNSQVQVQIPIKKVFYVERSVRAHYISIVSSEEELSVIANLQDVKAKTPFLFSCHRSFLVNPFNIRHVDRQLRMAFFPRGYCCPISRNRMMELLDLIQFQSYPASNSEENELE